MFMPSDVIFIGVYGDVWMVIWANDEVWETA